MIGEPEGHCLSLRYTALGTKTRHRPRILYGFLVSGPSARAYIGHSFAPTPLGGPETTTNEIYNKNTCIVAHLFSFVDPVLALRGLEL